MSGSTLNCKIGMVTDIFSRSCNKEEAFLVQLHSSGA